MKNTNKKKKVIVADNTSSITTKEVQISYEQAFLQLDTTLARGRKSIYLSPEHHERLTRIVQVIGDDKIPLFAYLNNILDHHFNVFEDAISKEYKEKYKSLF